MRLGRYIIFVIFFVGISVLMSGERPNLNSHAISSISLEQSIVPIQLSSKANHQITPYTSGNLSQVTCDEVFLVPYIAYDTYGQCYLPNMKPFYSTNFFWCSTCTCTTPDCIPSDACFGSNPAGFGNNQLSINACVNSGCNNWACAPGDIKPCEDGKGTQICEQTGCGGSWGECRIPKIESCEESVGNPINVITGEVTYQPSRMDIEISTANGSLALVRAYSSLRAFDDYLQEGVREIYTMFPIQSWGTGWYHQYEHTLFVGGNQTDVTSFFVYREPNGNRILFDENFKSKLHPSFSLSRVTDNNLGDDIYTLLLDDGSKLEFVRASLYSTSEVRDLYTPVFHLSHITEPSGRILTLQYYGATESSPCNIVEWSGKLCLITSDDGAFIRFSKYIKYIETRTDYRINMVQYGRFDFTSDGQSSLHYSKNYIVYEYTKKFRKPASSYPVRVLTYVDYFKDGEEYAPEIEKYEYTNLSYYRPDLDSVSIDGSTFPNPFASQNRILASDGLDVWLLRTVRDYKKDTTIGYESGYEFVSGHEYDQQGRGVASIRAGEYLRIAYFDLDPDKQITLVTNETRTDQIAEYESINGDLTKITGDCGCSLGKTESFERDTDSYVIAKRQQDANPLDSSPGTRTVFTYDDKKRIIIRLDNWEGAPPRIDNLRDILTANTALSNPTRVRIFEYNNSTSSIPKMVSRLFSVVCPYATQFGEECPPSNLEPHTERIFDSTGTRITSETEYGFTFQHGTGKVIEAERSHVITYVPNSSLLKSITDPNNRTTRYVYYLSSIENDPCVSSASTNVYNPGQVKEVWLNNHLIQKQGAYNEKGLIGCIIDENGVKTSFVYDRVGHVIQRKMEYGVQSRFSVFAYTFDGQLIQSSTGNIYHNYSYFAGSTPTDFCNNQSDPVSLQTCINGLGNLGQAMQDEIGIKLPNGSVFPAKILNSIYGVTGAPTLFSASGASGVITRQNGFAYDQNGNIWQQYKYIDQLADPNNLSGNATFTKLFTYDDLNQLRFSQDERFSQPNRGIKYDTLGRVESVTSGLGTNEEGTTRYKYDTNDNIVKVIDPDGRITEFLYDDFGQLVIVKSPDIRLTKYMYDPVGNPVEIQYADGTTKIMGYDDRHRLAVERFENKDKISVYLYFYDKPMIDIQWGLCLSHTSVRPPVSQTPAPADSSNTRPPGQQTPDPTNDNTRPLIEQTPAPIPPYGQTPTQIEVSQHFLKGRLSAVRHGAGWTFYSYTPFGEIEATYEWDGDESDPCNWRITRYQYDDSGRLESMTYPSGRSIRYVYNPEDFYPSRIELLALDGQGEITTSILIDNMSYDVDGNLAGYTAGQVTFSAQWDLAGQATRRNYQGAAGHNFDWVISSRDGNGNIESVGDTATNKILTLTYDGQDRLKSAIGTNLRGYQDCSYIYDASGNRILDNCYAKEIMYSYRELNGGIKTNQLETLSWDVPNSQTGQNVDVSQKFSYDELGRITNGYTEKFPTEDEQYTSSYDLAGHLQTVDINLDGQADYSYYYDHRNLRTQETSQISKTYYIYDLSGKLLSVQEVTEVREYIWLNDQPIAMLVNNGDTTNPILKTYVLGLDHLGTPMRAWDWATGEIEWAADYEAFGSAKEYVPHSPEIPGLHVDLRLPGQIFDHETRLYYNWHRWYDPGIGRYFQPDPLLAGIFILSNNSLHMFSTVDFTPTIYSQISAYNYSLNNPLNLIDTLGLKTCSSGRCSDCPSGKWVSKISGSSELTVLLAGGSSSCTRMCCIDADVCVQVCTTCLRVGVASFEAGCGIGLIYCLGSPCIEDLAGESGGIGGGFGPVGTSWDIGNKARSHCFSFFVGEYIGGWMGIQLCKTKVY